MTPELLSLLRCPQTMQRVSLIPPERLQAVSGASAGGGLEDPSAQPRLVREDGVLFYPVCDGLPVMLSEAAVLLQTVTPGHSVVSPE